MKRLQICIVMSLFFLAIDSLQASEHGHIELRNIGVLGDDDQGFNITNPIDHETCHQYCNSRTTTVASGILATVVLCSVLLPEDVWRVTNHTNNTIYVQYPGCSQTDGKGHRKYVDCKTLLFPKATKKIVMPNYDKKLCADYWSKMPASYYSYSQGCATKKSLESDCKKFGVYENSENNKYIVAPLCHKNNNENTTLNNLFDGFNLTDKDIYRIKNETERYLRGGFQFDTK